MASPESLLFGILNIWLIKCAYTYAYKYIHIHLSLSLSTLAFYGCCSCCHYYFFGGIHGDTACFIPLGGLAGDRTESSKLLRMLSER